MAAPVSFSRWLGPERCRQARNPLAEERDRFGVLPLSGEDIPALAASCQHIHTDCRAANCNVSQSGAANGDYPGDSATDGDDAQADAPNGNDADALERNDAETTDRDHTDTEWADTDKTNRAHTDCDGQAEQGRSEEHTS